MFQTQQVGVSTHTQPKAMFCSISFQDKVHALLLCLSSDTCIGVCIEKKKSRFKLCGSEFCLLLNKQESTDCCNIFD